ncbi:MAG: SsrA-binding protein [Parcubacteria group bacterium Gr01-1014_17]|nr:MAG: SsrA-binding protein [Parcubacteria group bacterium Gr01-1014_17]
MHLLDNKKAGFKYEFVRTLEAGIELFGFEDYDPRRNRKLLLTKSEITELTGVESRKGLTIVPVSVYSKGRKLKVGLALARGKKKYDKRETLKQRDVERDIRRTLKNQ